MADHVSVDRYMGAKEKFSSSHEADAYRLHRKRFAGGGGTYPLIGTPRHIADEMIRMSEVGFTGTTVSFVNFKNELPYFIENVLPLLREAGLRVA
jgi:alkanesulfonate monooxygenase SsuD/methylene tetrahydromethanopterin reductase-like flavin-dependent oxidoreductase (luciferase family)